MNIGLLGYGTIGSGVGELTALREDMSVKRVLDLRDIPELGDKLTKRFEDILEDAEIETVVELMGGINPAYDFLSRSLAAGKNAVTANKLMLSYHLADLLEIAKKTGAKLKIDASVGGGIPYLYNLIRARRIEKIQNVFGIVNGTTNLILDTMQEAGTDFDVVLKEAQKAGYAEANPSADIDGIDARSKVCITASLAFGKFVDPEKIAVAGIRTIKAADVEAFKAMKMVCRLIVNAEQKDETVAAFVEPTLVAPDRLEANVHKNYNLIGWNCANGNMQYFYGQGAGKIPTATNVLLGINDIMGGEDLMGGCPIDGKAVIDNSAVSHRYYLRTTAKPNVSAVALEGFEGVYITDVISVAEMHTAMAELKGQDEGLFFAAISE